MNRTKILIWSICLAAILGPTSVSANMGDPTAYGTRLAEPFIGRHVDILHERIRLEILSYESANWEIEYEIEADTSGYGLPFLFLALDLEDGFEAYLDGRPVTLQLAPGKPLPRDPIWQRPEAYFRGLPASDSAWEWLDLGLEGYREVFELSDFTYFEADLEKGRHQFRIVYRSQATVRNHARVKEYVFHYALGPARQWRSFRGLTVELNNLAAGIPLKSNLGPAEAGSIDSVAIWTLAALPEDPFVSFTSNPLLEPLAVWAVQTGPESIGLGAFALVAVLFLVVVVVRRVRKPTRNLHSWFNYVGGLLVGLWGGVALALGERVVDVLIGEHVSEGPSYYLFFVILTGPVVVLVSTFLPVLVDAIVQGILRRKQNLGAKG
ncbi:MAG: hypothetical protein AAF998_14685 [Bacteroidota bacterium]